MAKGEKENGERWGRPIREGLNSPPDFSGPILFKPVLDRF